MRLLCRRGSHWSGLVYAFFGALIIGLILFAGCSLPNSGGATQQGPPAMSAPPGLESGGAHAVMAPAITAPNDSVLSVRFTLNPGVSIGPETKSYADSWHTCRRIVLGDQAVMIEGIDYNKTAMEGTENGLLVPFKAISEMAWKYEKLTSTPVPPSATNSEKKASASNK